MTKKMKGIPPCGSPISLVTKSALKCYVIAEKQHSRHSFSMVSKF